MPPHVYVMTDVQMTGMANEILIRYIQLYFLYYNTDKINSSVFLKTIIFS